MGMAMFQAMMPPREHDGADVGADDVAHAEERRREIGADIRDALAQYAAHCAVSGMMLQAARRHAPSEPAGRGRAAEHFTPCAGIVPGAQHFRGGLAFGESHALLDDQ